MIYRDFPGNPVVKTALPLQGAQVRSLVEELRSCMVKKKIKTHCIDSDHFQKHHTENCFIRAGNLVCPKLKILLPCGGKKLREPF